jgi:hypothetical protein
MELRKSTITLTFGDSAENHVGMEQLGRRVSPGQGFTCEELLAIRDRLQFTDITCEYISLNNVPDFPAASVLIIRNGVNKLLGRSDGADALFAEQAALPVDRQAFMYGRVVNKHARWNLCFDSFDQEPDYAAGKGRVIRIDNLPLTAALYNAMPITFGPKATDLKVEGNYYYDSSKCGIGYHGDSERRKVIGVRIGATMPLYYQWYHGGLKTGDRIQLSLNHGDIYIMSEKAVGTDWKSRLIPTLRHAAGAPKFTDI